MTNNTNQVLVWLKDFKKSWLPQNIPNDHRLLKSIKTKLFELEQLIIGKLNFSVVLTKVLHISKQ